MHKNKSIPAIEVAGAAFSYDGESVLQDINLDIFERDFMVIIGPNGGGKSTLVKLILGILPLKKGSIKVLNEVPGKTTLSQIGYVPQNTDINLGFPIKTVEVVMMGQRSGKRAFFGYQKQELAHAELMLEKVGMLEYAQKKIGTLSGGQRQRVMIARALYLNPKILLLDEPTASIDADGQKQIYELLRDLNKEITVVVVSHDISVILEYASKVAYINKKLSFHDLGSIKKEFDTNGEHICEVELLQMLGKKKC